VAKKTCGIANQQQDILMQREKEVKKGDEKHIKERKHIKEGKRIKEGNNIFIY
jgi:hypothetical protein